MRYLKLFENWQSGMEFGKRRDEISEPKTISKANQTKLDSLSQKESKILAKIKSDKNSEFTVKKSVMGKTEKVSGKEALELISDAKDAIKRGVTSGIMIYV